MSQEADAGRHSLSTLTLPHFCEPPDKPKLVDGSDELFSMYNKRAKKNDEKMAERWKGDAEGMLIFVRGSFRFFARRPLK
jgi:hypothetical protein